MRAELLLAALAGFSAVGMGAFGTHALSGRLGGDRLRTYQTGVQYHLIHALAALLAGTLALSTGRPGWLIWAGWCYLAGIVLFSGSLYGLALQKLGTRWGIVTPMGGGLFLAGWVLLAVGVLTLR